MLKAVLFSTTLLLTAPVLAQTAAPATPNVAPPPEFIAAAQAFGQCVGKNIAGQATTLTPEAGAKQALAGCAAERTALDTHFETWVANPNFPEAGRAVAREQFTAQMTGVEAQIADRIRASRTKPTTPAPAPSPTPKPTR